MKILLGSSLYVPNAIGGAEKVVQSLASTFANDGHTVSVITTQPKGDARQAIVCGVSVHYVTVQNLYRPFGDFKPGSILKSFWRLIDSYNLFMVRKFIRIMTREKPDVVNTHNITGLSVSIWTAAKRLGIPIVHTMHDQYLLCHRSTMFKAGKNCVTQCNDCRILTMPRKSLSNSVDCCIGVSDFILQRHKNLGYFQAATPFVIYNKIQHPKSSKNTTSVMQRPLRFGFLGQLIPSKGLATLIAAYRDAHLNDTELCIAGAEDSTYASELRQTTRHEKNIMWRGYVQPEDYFTEIDVLVVPSAWNDTAPLVISEALNYGVPVLASRRGGIPELMGYGAGWLYEPDTPHALRIALQKCSDSREHLTQMKDACLKHAKKFISSNWTAEYLTAYQAAINRHCGDNKKDNASLYQEKFDDT